MFIKIYIRVDEYINVPIFSSSLISLVQGILVPDNTVHMVTIPYLGLTITFNNSDWLALYSNLWKTHRRWRIVEKVLRKTGHQ